MLVSPHGSVDLKPLLLPPPEAERAAKRANGFARKIVMSSRELSDLLISDPVDDDLMFLLENFAGDDITTKPNNIITENNHDEVKEYDLFINFEESIFQDDFIYISELG